MKDSERTDGNGNYVAQRRRTEAPRGPHRDGRALRVTLSLPYARDRAALGFGESLEAALRDHNVAVAELAAAIEVNESTVHKWMSGRGVPHLGQVLRIAWALGVSVATLVQEVQ